VEIAGANAYLIRPSTAIRVRWDNDQETPLPPETPAGKNPPDGAIFDYYLKSVPSGVLTLEIHDAQGKLVRRFTSLTPTPDSTPKNVPEILVWADARAFEKCGTQPLCLGPALRFALKTLPFSYYGTFLTTSSTRFPITRFPKRLRVSKRWAYSRSGKYEAVLIANGVLMKQPFTVTLDPRVHVSQADLQKQLDAGNRIDAGLPQVIRTYLAVAP